MQSGFVTHKNKRIYIANYDHLSFDDFEKEINYVTEEICREALDSVVCVNVTTGLVGTPRVIQLFQWSVAKTKPYVYKAAVVGIGYSGARKSLMEFILKVTGQNAVLFDDLEKAKDYLAED